MNYVLWGIIILILVLLILLLVIALLKLINKATYLSKKEKEFLEFAVDMYINYSKELNIHSPEEHDIIVRNLEKIRNEKLLK